MGTWPHRNAAGLMEIGWVENADQARAGVSGK